MKDIRYGAGGGGAEEEGEEDVDVGVGVDPAEADFHDSRFCCSTVWTLSARR